MLHQIIHSFLNRVLLLTTWIAAKCKFATNKNFQLFLLCTVGRLIEPDHVITWTENIIPCPVFWHMKSHGQLVRMRQTEMPCGPTTAVASAIIIHSLREGRKYELSDMLLKAHAALQIFVIS